MSTGLHTTALVMLGLIGGVACAAVAQDSGRGATARRPAAFSLNATVSRVDVDRDRVIVRGDDGKTYTVDTYRTDIKLRDTDQAGETSDLEPGMRLHITGSLLSRDLIEPDRVVVLPGRDAHTVPVVVSNSSRRDRQDRNITLRGTVESTDDQRGSFVVKVNNHTRTVFLNDHTDIGDYHMADNSELPVRSGDRVSVVGKLTPDGTVDASLVTPRILGDTAVATAQAQHGRTLIGRVADSSGLFSRDIKLRTAVDRVIPVSVPKNIPITRDGNSISIHDLKDDQVIRVNGEYNGDQFDATRIQLLPDSAGRNLDF